MLSRWIGVIIFLMSLLFNVLPFSIAMIVSIIVATLCAFKLKEDLILYVILISLFFLRAITGINFNTYSSGDEVRLRYNLANKSIERMDGRRPQERSFLVIRRYGKGRFKSRVVVKGIEERNGAKYYSVKIKEEEELSKGLYRRVLDKQVKKIVKSYPKEFKGIYRGIVVGDKSYITRSIMEKFRYTGTSHLLVISGLHIGLVTVFIMYIVGKLPISHDLRYLVAIIVLTLYIASIEISPSSIRAYIMGMCYLVGKLIYEDTDIEKSIYIALVINLFIDPLGAMNISLQMSFLAVFAIIYIYPMIKRVIDRKILNEWLKKIFYLMGISFSIQILLLPVTLINFRGIPIFSFIINVVAVPLGMIVIQGFFLLLFLSFINLHIILLPTVYLLYKMLMIFIEIASKIPLLTLYYRGVTFGYIAILMYVFYFLILSKNYRRYSFIPILLIYLLNLEGKSVKVSDRYIYYPKSKILITSNKIAYSDINNIFNDRIRSIDYLITSKSQKKDILERLDIGGDIYLKRNEEIEVEGYKYENKGGKIIRR